MNNLLIGVESELDIEDYDTIDELKDSFDDEENITAELIRDREGIMQELAQLEEYAKLAQSITENSKGENLLTALHKGLMKQKNLVDKEKLLSLQNQEEHKIIYTICYQTMDMRVRLLSLMALIVTLIQKESLTNGKSVIKMTEEFQALEPLILRQLLLKNLEIEQVF